MSARCAPRLAAVVAVVALLALSCRDAAPERATLTVFAASSLQEAFGELEGAFERQHPQVDLRVQLAGSQALRLQIEQGAQADLFASANVEHLDALDRAGLITRRQPLASNRLALVVPRDNPAQIKRFQDLPLAKRLVVGAPEVPVGAYTQALLDKASGRYGAAFGQVVRQHIASREANVRLVRAKVELGEADAAIVYASDAVGRDQLAQIPIPDDLNVSVVYHIGAVKGGASGEWGERFLGWLGEEEARGLLARRGLTP